MELWSSLKSIDSPKKRLPFLIIILCVLAVLAASLFKSIYLNKAIPLQASSINFIVPTGSSSYSIAAHLKQQEILKQPRLFSWLMRWQKLDTKIHAGEYMLENPSSIQSIIDKITTGKVYQRELTLVEGKTFADFKAMLLKAPGIKTTLKPFDMQHVLQKLGENNKSAEGLFLPETYYYTYGRTDLELLTQAYKAMREELDQAWQQRAKALPYKNAYQGLIMASLIEKETAVKSERGLIAGVLVNRLVKGIKLQVDPTVIYGLGEKFNGNLTKKDLRKDTPYNTYVHYGLPPTPIALPGREAIYAAFHPEKTNALYFVAKGDGSHEFSNTLKKHNQAVRKYQLKKRNK